MVEFSDRQLRAQIAENQRATAVPAIAHHIAVEGWSELAVRERGAFTLKAALTNPQTGRQTDILYCEPDVKRPKLTASHPMIPVGAYDGPGGQHGPARWVDYTLQSSCQMDTTANMNLCAFLPGPASFFRRYVLRASGLVTISRIEPCQGQQQRTSLGHHDYYALNQETDIHELTINGERFDDLLGEGGAAEAIMGGQARFWPGFRDGTQGNARVRFPDGRIVDIVAETDRGQAVGMLLWHRRGTRSVCLEPTVGVVQTDEGLDTRALHLGSAAAHGATLDVSISLVGTTTAAA